MKLFLSIEPPHNWVITGPRNQVRDSGVATALENYRVPKGVEQVIGVVNGDYVSCHSVKIPGKRKHHIEAALGFALEDRITDDVENLHFKLLQWQADGITYCAVVSRNQLSQWVEKLQNYGIYLDALIPDYFLLPQHPKCSVSVSKLRDNRICVRLSAYKGLSLDQDGFNYWWETLDKTDLTCAVTDIDMARTLVNSFEGDMESANKENISHWDIGSDFSDWLGHSQFDQNVDDLNLLDGRYSPVHNKKGKNLLKVAALVFVISLFGSLGMMLYETNVLNSQRTEINTELRTLFSQYFPDEPYLDRPKSQLTNLISNARAGKSKKSTFQTYLHAVSEIAPRLGVIINEISFRDNDMILLCTVKDLASLDTIIEAFNEVQSIEAELLSSGARDGKVNGRFRLGEGA